MNILLINPITSFKNIKKDRKGVLYPLGIGYIGAYLQQHGHNVEILDNNQRCLTKHEIVDFLKSKSPDIIGIGAMVNSYNQVQNLSRLIKNTIKDIPIVLGGPMATYCSQIVLKNMDIDICVMGEGEETSSELFSVWPNYESINGISYMQGDKYIETPARTFKYGRDSYPYPGYDNLLNLENYLRFNLTSWETPFFHDKYMRLYRKKSVQGGRNFSMITGMGCPYKCTFCTNSTNYMKSRMRSPENVAKEASYLKDKYNISGIHFADDLLILNKSRTLELCSELKKTGLQWAGQSVGRATADEEVVKSLSESGCVGFGLGIESGSDRLLQAMMKGSRTKDYVASFEYALKYNIGIRIQMLYGSPGETKETLQETISWFHKTGLPPRRYNKLVPMPGSLNYDQCVEQGIITNEHNFLSYMSLIWGYASKEFIFNITSMGDEEYIANCDWAEKNMFDNYSKNIKKDPYYYPLMLLYYIKKISSLKVIIRKLKQFFLKKTEKKLTSKEISDMVAYYPSLTTNMDNPGFINKPLTDERINKIFLK